MKPTFISEDRDNLSINEEIELLKALNEADQWPGEADIEELDLPEYYNE